ncbi:unnamed protein product [Clonostachys solani]|uniref:Zn(2)-C6 fungal-type domain-containing protein n=1 Tax=Clonostachys solani TaxID=160281 RepID=A0A9N9ZF98_9HYPO|nr:unnamed protein product [Clonostachys solani]
MYGPPPTRINKTDIKRSRGGCARCRQKRRKVSLAPRVTECMTYCDEGKPKCGRCVANESDCQYERVALKFRESTQWAAQKVESSKGIVQSRLGTLDAMNHGSSSSPQDDVPACEVGNESPVACAATACESTPHAPRLAQQDNTWDGVPELSIEAEAQSAYPSPDSGHQWAIEPDLMAFSTPFLQSRCTDIELDFDLPLDGANSDFAQLFDFAEIPPGPRVPEVLSIDAQVPGREAQDESPVAVYQEQTRRAAALTCTDTERNTLGASETFLEPMILNSPSDEESSSPSSTDHHLFRGRSNVQHAEVLSQQLRTPVGKLQRRLPSKISVKDRIYLAHFKVSVLQSFPVELPFLWDLVIACETVCCAALALAAANLANLQGKQADNYGGTWAAMPTHSTKATAFTAQTVQLLESDTGLPLDARLVTMMLAFYYELEAGSFSSVCHALSILNVTILNRLDDVLSLVEGYSLIRWWLSLRSLIANAQGPHTPYGPENPTETFVNNLELKVAAPSQMIELIGTRARRLWHRLLVTKGFGVCGDTPASTMKKVDEWWSILKGHDICSLSEDEGTRGRFLTEEELYAELRHLKTILKSCEAPSDFQEEFLELDHSAEKIEPLRFSSHRRAMEIVDYAFAHVVCDESLLRDLADRSTELPRQFPDTSPDITNPWVGLILRVAAGLDIPKYGRENAYRRGIVSCLFITGLFCPGQVSSRSIKDAVNRIASGRTYSEGPFYPLHAFLGFQQALEREIAKGHTIFFSCLTYDEWTSKEKLFSDGKDEYLIVIGCTADGRYFNDLVPAISDL